MDVDELSKICSRLKPGLGGQRSQTGSAIAASGRFEIGGGPHDADVPHPGPSKDKGLGIKVRLVNLFEWMDCGCVSPTKPSGRSGVIVFTSASQVSIRGSAGSERHRQADEIA